MAADEASWAGEIRAYLLGRLSQNRGVGELDHSEPVRLPAAPIRLWWLFEGKRYAPLDGRLCDNWPHIRRSILATMRTYNPTWRVTDRADDCVDWGRTLAHCPGAYPREFIVQSTHAGLDDAERNVLTGWIGWITQQWIAYEGWHCDARSGPLHGLPQADFLQAAPLQRWAHIARRSRWPLLRGVVAETLRVVLEVQDVERVPLPSERATLFELLCLVRILKAFAPQPEALRWLSRETDNTISIAELTAKYQCSVPRDRALAAYRDSDPACLEIFGVRVPSRADLVFDFGGRIRNGLSGIIVEAKSGDQDYGTALEQLRVYRVANPRAAGQRFLVWAITEHASPIRTEQLAWIRQRREQSDDDVWVFSGIDDVASVLAAMFE